MPRVHAVADGIGIDPVALCGLIAMCFSIPGVGLFAVCYRSIEGVLDLVAFSRVRGMPNVIGKQGREGECGHEFQLSEICRLFRAHDSLSSSRSGLDPAIPNCFERLRAALATVLTRLRPASATISNGGARRDQVDADDQAPAPRWQCLAIP